MIETLQRVLTHFGDRLRTVRLAGGVAQIQDRLVRQLVENRAGDGESPEA